MSVDAIFHFGINHSGRMFLHVARNLALIPYALNAAKHIQLPLALQKISQYYREFKEIQTALLLRDTCAMERVDVIQERSLVNCRRYTDIGMKAGRQVKRRSGPTMFQEQLAYFRGEWISGKIHRGSKVRIIRRYVRPFVMPEGPHWSEIMKASIENIDSTLVRGIAPKASRLSILCPRSHHGARLGLEHLPRLDA